MQSASSGFIRPEDGQVVIFLLGELGEFLKFTLKYSEIMSLGVIWYEEFEKNVFIAVAPLRTSVLRDYTIIELICGLFRNSLITTFRFGILLSDSSK